MGPLTSRIILLGSRGRGGVTSTPFSLPTKLDFPPGAALAGSWGLGHLPSGTELLTGPGPGPGVESSGERGEACLRFFKPLRVTPPRGMFRVGHLHMCGVACLFSRHSALAHLGALSLPAPGSWLRAEALRKGVNRPGALQGAPPRVPLPPLSPGGPAPAMPSPHVRAGQALPLSHRRSGGPSGPSSSASGMSGRRSVRRAWR